MLSGSIVTIGITAYNAEATIEKAIASASNQTWNPIEIVVIDDCSSDDTVAIIHRIARRDGRVRLFRNPVNYGVAVSRNRIIEEARGEFLAFFDDDDESLPERVAAQLMRILDYESTYASGAPVICHTARRVTYPNGTQRVEPTMGQSTERKAPSGPAVAKRILMGTPLEDGYGACPTCSQMAKLSTYRSLNGFDPAFRRSEDTEFNVRLAQAGGHFVGIAYPLVNQIMTATSEKSIQDEYCYAIRMLEKHRSLLGGRERFAFYCLWTDAKFAWLRNDYLKFIWLFGAAFIRHPLLSAGRLLTALPSFGLNAELGKFYSRFDAGDGR